MEHALTDGDPGRPGRRPYVTEGRDGGPSLREAMAAGRTFGGAELRRLAAAVAAALAEIHDAGAAHRDLRPDNVLLGRGGARVVGFGSAPRRPPSGGIAAILTYRAPEVIVGARAGTPADVFAWGAVVLFAATGDDPFRAASLGAVMHRVLSVDPDLAPLPAALRGPVRGALAKDAAARPTAAALLPALRGARLAADA